jgi:hypothetical protein
MRIPGNSCGFRLGVYDVRKLVFCDECGQYRTSPHKQRMDQVGSSLLELRYANEIIRQHLHEWLRLSRRLEECGLPLPATSCRADEGLRQHPGVGAGVGCPAETTVRVEVRVAGQAESRGRNRSGNSETTEAERGGRPAEAGAGGPDAGSKFFQKCLAKTEGATPSERRQWRASIYEQIGEVMRLQGETSVERLCQLAGVSRAGYYRALVEKEPEQEEMRVRASIQEIALAHRRRYGYRWITVELRRRGLQVNHKWRG